MTGLYGNVNVGNTVGLYQQNTGTSQVLTSAQSLLSLLSNASTVGFSLTSANTQVQGTVVPSGVTAGTYGSGSQIPVITVGSDGRVTSISIDTNTGGTYGNANVAAYLAGTVTIGNLTVVSGVYWANGQPYSSGGSGTIYGNANVVSLLGNFGSNSISTTGNVTAGNVLSNNYLYANGVSILTGVTGNYSNTNVAAYLTTATINTTGNITGANLTTAGNLTAAYVKGNGSLLTALTGASAGVYGSDILIPSINVDASGRIISITTNAVSGGGSYGNANVGLYLASNSALTISTTANITTTANVISPNYLYPNGVSILTGIGGSTYSNTNVAAYLTTATINTTGNITGANLTTAGNLTASYVKGDGSLLINLPVQAGTYSNTNVAAYLPTYNSTIGTATGTVTIGGNLTTTSKTTTGNLVTSAGLYWANGVNYSSTVAGTYSNTNVTAYLSGTVSVGNIASTNGYFWANGTAYSTGGVTQIVAGTNLNISPAGGTGVVTINANTQAGTYSNANVASYLPTYAGNVGSGSAQIIGSQNYIPNLYNVSNIRGPVTFGSGNIWIDTYGYTGLNISNTQIVSLNVPLKVRGGFSFTVEDGGQIASGGNITANAGAYFIGDGSKLTNISAAQTYGNANVAAYLPTYSGNLGGTLTTTTQPYISNIAGAAATTTIGYKASIAAGAGSTVLGSANGIYLNAAIASDGTVGSQAFLNTTNQFVTTAQITGNISSTNGYFWGNGTAYSTINNGVTAIVAGTGITANAATGVVSISATGGGGSFSGNLSGNVLYDTVNERILMQAATTTANIGGPVFPSGTFLSTNFFAPNALSFYGNGVVSPATGSGVGTYVASANLTIGTRNGTNWSPTSQYNLSQMYPDPGAASMSNADRVRGVNNVMELYPSGKNWGTVYTPSAANASTAANLTTVVAMNGLLSTVGTGYVSHAIAVAATNQLNPVGGSANIFMQTGSYASIGWNSATAVTAGRLASNIGYARLFGGVINGGSQQANLTITNAVGLHITNSWAPGGVGGVDTITNRYAVLNEDAGTKIQTNGNLVVTGNTQIQGLQETVSATGFTGGAWTVNAANGTIQTATLTSSISSLSFTNLPPGGTVTLIITQGGSGSYTLTTTGIKYAGGSSTLSTAVGAIDMLNILYDGTNYYGSLVKGYA